MINKAIDNKEQNRKEVISVLEKNPRGLSISDIFRSTKLSRTQVRTAIEHLLGSKKVNEDQVGMAKVYSLK